MIILPINIIIILLYGIQTSYYFKLIIKLDKTFQELLIILYHGDVKHSEWSLEPIPVILINQDLIHWCTGRKSDSQATMICYYKEITAFLRVYAHALKEYADSKFIIFYQNIIMIKILKCNNN